MIALDIFFADVDHDHGHRHVTTCTTCDGCGEGCPRCGTSGTTVHDEDDCPGFGECDEAEELVAESDDEPAALVVPTPEGEVRDLRHHCAVLLDCAGFFATAKALRAAPTPAGVIAVLLTAMGDVRLTAEVEAALEALFDSACAAMPRGDVQHLPCELLWTPADAVVRGAA